MFPDAKTSPVVPEGDAIDSDPRLRELSIEIYSLAQLRKLYSGLNKSEPSRKSRGARIFTQLSISAWLENWGSWKREKEGESDE